MWIHTVIGIFELSSRAALHRYTHYYDRFMNHSKSRELESKLREKTIEKMEKMQDEGNKTWLDVQFMKQATTQLIQARQILQVNMNLLISYYYGNRAVFSKS